MSDSQEEVKVAPWENVALRIIAIYKLGKALVFIAAAVGLREFKNTDVNQFLNEYIVEHNIDPESNLVHHITEWVSAHANYFNADHMMWYSFFLFSAAALFVAEGFGLYFRKHWAEYLVVISTGALLPVEFYEFWGTQFAWWKFGVITGNILIVGYLIHRLILDAKLKAEREQEKNARAAGRAAAKQEVSKVQ